MEIKITSAMVGAILALLGVLLFTNYANSKAIANIESRQERMSKDVSSIKEVLTDPEKTTFD